MNFTRRLNPAENTIHLLNSSFDVENQVKSPKVTGTVPVSLKGDAVRLSLKPLAVTLSSVDLIQEIAEYSGGSLNDGRTLLHTSRSQPFLPIFLVIQMEPCDVVADMASKLFFELIPEFSALSIDLCHRLLIFGIGSSYFHPNSHDRTGECPTK
jgi:hypothetical protein